MTAPLSSEAATAGRQISAMLIAPVAIDGTIAMNAGATVTGRVRNVTSTKDRAQARLTPVFDEIRDAAGHRAKLAAKLTAIDNARETVDADGHECLICDFAGKSREAPGTPPWTRPTRASTIRPVSR